MKLVLGRATTRESPSVVRVLGEHVDWLENEERRRIATIDESPYPAADGSALLLGHDLWLAPLLQFRDELAEALDVPPLWRFPWLPSADWNVEPWLALPTEARILRARAGSLAHEVALRGTARSLGMTAAAYSSGLSALRSAGAATETSGIALAPIAEEFALRTDLSLVQLLVHWLRMLAHHDRVLLNSEGNGFDVGGYEHGCDRCRSRWGPAPRTEEAMPPFHPGCRCFAQPRFAS